MNVRFGAVLLVAGLICVGTVTGADDLKSGLDKKTGGAFQVKAFTGDNKGKQLCYV